MIPKPPEDYDWHFWQDLLSLAAIFAAVVIISTIAAYFAEHYGK
jgi:hypothetical protein